MVWCLGQLSCYWMPCLTLQLTGGKLKVAPGFILIHDLLTVQGCAGAKRLISWPLGSRPGELHQRGRGQGTCVIPRATSLRPHRHTGEHTLRTHSPALNPMKSGPEGLLILACQGPGSLARAPRVLSVPGLAWSCSRREYRAAREDKLYRSRAIAQASACSSS